MTKPEKEKLFTTAYQNLKLALAFADAMKYNPTANSSMAWELTTRCQKANASALAFESAMRGVEPPKLGG